MLRAPLSEGGVEAETSRRSLEYLWGFIEREGCRIMG